MSPRSFAPLAGSLGLSAVLAAFMTFALAQPVQAQGLEALDGGDAPVEIFADEGIEWRRNERVYIARGNAEAHRGNITIYADVLRALYREGGGEGGQDGQQSAAGGGNQIYRLEAEGSVRIVSPNETAYGDLAVYEVDRSMAVLTGDNLRLETPTETVTARDALEYWGADRRAVARGDAAVVQEERRIEAETLTAYFEPGANDQLQMRRIDADENVEITSPTEYARGDTATYDLDTQIATLMGDVRLSRGENQLNGGYAEVNLETGVSRLLGAPPGGTPQRVRGLLQPGSNGGMSGTTQ